MNAGSADPEARALWRTGAAIGEGVEVTRRYGGLGDVVIKWPKRLVLVADQMYADKGVHRAWRTLLSDLSWLAELAAGRRPDLSAFSEPLRLRADREAADFLEVPRNVTWDPDLLDMARNRPTHLAGAVVDPVCVDSASSFDRALAVVADAARHDSIAWLGFRLGADADLHRVQRAVFERLRQEASSHPDPQRRQLADAFLEDGPCEDNDLWGGAALTLVYSGGPPGRLRLVGLSSAFLIGPAVMPQFPPVATGEALISHPLHSVAQALSSWCRQDRARRDWSARLWPSGSEGGFTSTGLDGRPAADPRFHHNFEEAEKEFGAERTVRAVGEYLDDLLLGSVPESWVERGQVRGLWEVLKTIVGRQSDAGCPADQDDGGHELSFPAIGLLAAMVLSEVAQPAGLTDLSGLDWSRFARGKKTPVAALPHQRSKTAREATAAVVQFWRHLLVTEDGQTTTLTALEISHNAVRATLRIDASSFLRALAERGDGEACAALWRLVRMTGITDEGAFGFSPRMLIRLGPAAAGGLAVELVVSQPSKPAFAGEAVS